MPNPRGSEAPVGPEAPASTTQAEKQPIDLADAAAALIGRLKHFLGFEQSSPDSTKK